MNEYTFEIHIPISSFSSTYKFVENGTVTAFTEEEAHNHAREFADNRHNSWNIKKLRMTKKFTNPDNEI